MGCGELSPDDGPVVLGFVAAIHDVSEDVSAAVSPVVEEQDVDTRWGILSGVPRSAYAPACANVRASPC